MKNLKWWHWVLIVMFGVVAIDLSVRGVPEDTKQNGSHSVKFSPADAKFTSISGNHIWAMVFDANANPKSLPALARERCKYLQRCTIYGWTDPSLVAGAMPLLQHEAAAVVFSYEVNRLDNFEVIKWDCAKWQQSNPKLCLP